MFEPVWLGNYIVPRWEAIALVIGVPAISLFVVVILGALSYYGAVFIVKYITE